uniref:Uncharacterized protein n=1 Tax=Octopus bimaculoides TaxID=37653 RepID=A0A0L8I7T8_OCTBM
MNITTELITAVNFTLSNNTTSNIIHSMIFPAVAKIPSKKLNHLKGERKFVEKMINFIAALIKSEMSETGEVTLVETPVAAFGYTVGSERLAIVK